jgi:hypothetical protein
MMVGSKRCDILLDWSRAQATFSTQRSRLNTRVVHVGFVVARVVQGQVFVQVTSFSSCHHSTIVPYLPVIMCWLNRPTWGCSIKELCLTPLLQSKDKRWKYFCEKKKWSAMKQAIASHIYIHFQLWVWCLNV